ncbi:unnamed protein product [Oncorhynchus mykiss]|uniref:Uncharacterized protein n=1 Tax=Oncorhynchus mykiss TaxID=8022 RepID=A0A060XBR8_ONCMY|nr:unnamed protein product [Oncorhynchus mykiss]
MGVVGGLLGAFFNYINKRLDKYRRVLESLLVAMVTTVGIFVASITLANVATWPPPQPTTVQRRYFQPR